MTIITTIYFAVTEPSRKLDLGKIIKREDPLPKNTNRNIVVMYQGTSRV